MSINPAFDEESIVRLPVKEERQESGAGEFIRRWRERRHLSQKELAAAADVSCRHISFIETGRSKPSRKMILRLSEVLDLPYRSRNNVLESGGFGPEFTETTPKCEGFEEASTVLNTFLGRQEPNPAVVLDGHWNVVRANESARKLFAFILGRDDRNDTSETNLIRWLTTEPALREAIENWNDVAVELIRRLHRRIELEGADRFDQSLIDDLIRTLSTEERAGLDQSRADNQADLAVPIRIRRAGMAMSFFALTTKFGGPKDITLQELRVESLHPACKDTEEAMRFLQISRL